MEIDGALDLISATEKNKPGEYIGSRQREMLINKQGIRQKVHSFWLRRELPTFDKILQVIHDDDDLPNLSRSNLDRVLKKMDFVYKKRNSVLMEREDLINWRRNYMYDIRKFREQNRPIYYLDETRINSGNCWCSIILQIGSEKGFDPNGLKKNYLKSIRMDYHDKMNGDKFREWFKNILPTLERNSVIVIDNAPYHSVKVEKFPTSNWKKDDIMVWLKSKGETFGRPMVKAQLITRVRQIEDRYEGNVIENIAADAEHTVLRLPPNHSEFNPVELAWVMVKGHVRNKNSTLKLADVKQLLHEAIQRITPENWCNFIKHVVEEENKIWSIDDIIDDIIDNMDPCVLTTTENTSSSDSDFD